MRRLRFVGPLLLAAVVVLVLVGYSSTRSAPAGPARAAALVGAASLEQQFVQTVKRVAPSVVQVETPSGLGSGVVFDTKGDIVTNAHVVGSARRFTITLASGKQFRGTLVGAFAPDDLAVIHIEASGLTPAELADSSQLSVGAIVMAVGNPLGFRSSVTEGIISGLRRTVSEPNGVALPGVIQTSAAINPGNSGGALVDLGGRVVGIPTLAATDPELGGAQAPGIGFAVPSNTVRDVASQLIQNGRVTNSHRAFLGVRIADTIGGNGVLVGQVTRGGAADRAGIKAGDTIAAVNGQPTPSAADLSSLLANLKPGQKVKVDLVHSNGSRARLTVTLGQYPGG